MVTTHVSKPNTIDLYTTTPPEHRINNVCFTGVYGMYLTEFKRVCCCCVPDVEQAAEPTCVRQSHWWVLEEPVHNAAEDQRVSVTVQ